MSGASKKRGLSPDGISELVWNSESEDTEASSDSTSEDEGDFQEEPGVSHLHRTAQHPVVKRQQFDLNKCL